MWPSTKSSSSSHASWKMFRLLTTMCSRQMLLECSQRSLRNNTFRTSRSFWDRLWLTKTTTSCQLLLYPTSISSRREATPQRLPRNQTMSYKTSCLTQLMATFSTNLWFFFLKWRKMTTCRVSSFSLLWLRKNWIRQSWNASLSDISNGHCSTTLQSTRRLPGSASPLLSPSSIKKRKRVFN